MAACGDVAVLRPVRGKERRRSSDLTAIPEMSSSRVGSLALSPSFPFLP